MLTYQQLQYLGAVRTPANDTSRVSPAGAVDGLGFGGHPFCVDHARKEYIFGTNGKRTLRLAIVPPAMPRYRTSGDVKLLDLMSVPAAPYVDGVAVDLSNDRWRELNVSDDAGDGAPGGLQVVSDRIVGAGTIYYDASHAQDVSFFIAEWPVTSVRPVLRSPWRELAGLKEGVVAGPMALIPERYRAQLKGDIVSGQTGLPIITRQSMGPCAVAWRVNDLLSLDHLAATMLVGYVGVNMPGTSWGGQANDLYNISTSIRGIAFIGSDLVFIGTHGCGVSCYGAGTGDTAIAGTPDEFGQPYCYDPTSSSKGTHAYPYRLQAWVYPVADLIAVVNGLRKPYELIPTWFPIDVPLFEHPEYKQAPGTLLAPEVNGIGYDAATAELHICLCAQDSNGWEPKPLVHRFKVNGVALEANPQPTPTTVAIPTDGGPVIIEPPVDPPPIVIPPIDSTDPTPIDVLEARVVELETEVLLWRGRYEETFEARNEAVRQAAEMSVQLTDARTALHDALVARDQAVSEQQLATFRLTQVSARVDAIRSEVQFILAKLEKLKGYPGWIFDRLRSALSK